MQWNVITFLACIFHAVYDYFYLFSRLSLLMRIYTQISFIFREHLSMCTFLNMFLKKTSLKTHSNSEHPEPKHPFRRETFSGTQHSRGTDHLPQVFLKLMMETRCRASKVKGVHYLYSHANNTYYIYGAIVITVISYKCQLQLMSLLTLSVTVSCQYGAMTAY